MKKELFTGLLAICIAMISGCISDPQNSQDNSDQKATESSNENLKADSASESKDNSTEIQTLNSSETRNSSSGSEKSSDPEKSGSANEDSSNHTDSEPSFSRSSSKDQNESADPVSDSSGADSAQNQDSVGTGAQSCTDQNAGAIELMASSIASKLAQAIHDQGILCSQIEYEMTDTGNAVASFRAGTGPEAALIFVTSSVSAPMAQKTFDANCADDEAQDMRIMNEWTDNGNLVRVIRNNMANGNYIEVIDQYQSSAIHIANTLPEQIDVMLSALQNIGYPVS